MAFRHYKWVMYHWDGKADGSAACIGYKQLEDEREISFYKGNDIYHRVIIMKNCRMQEVHMEDNTALISQ